MTAARALVAVVVTAVIAGILTLALTSATTPGYLILVCAAIVALGSSLAVWPKAMVPDIPEIDAPKRVELQNGVRASLISGISLVSVLGAASIAWVQFAATQDQLKMTLRQQEAESYSRTIQLLGADQSYERYVGVVQLRNIAERLSAADTTTDPANPLSVADIKLLLARFVRAEISKDERSRREEAADQVGSLRRYHPDVEEALGTISALNPEGGTGLDLRQTDMRGASLAKANLDGLYLSFADLSYSDSRNDDFAGPSFVGTRLNGAALSYAQLPGADFTDASLMYTHMRKVGLQKACFLGSDLSHTYKLATSTLTGALYTEDTSFPADLSPEAEGMVLVEPDTHCPRTYS